MRAEKPLQVVRTNALMSVHANHLSVQTRSDPDAGVIFIKVNDDGFEGEDPKLAGWDWDGRGCRSAGKCRTEDCRRMPLAQSLLSAAAILASVTMPGLAQDATVKAELAPTGALRVGLVEAPDAGLVFVNSSKDGKPDGVTADLSTDLAQALGLPGKFTLFPN